MARKPVNPYERFLREVAAALSEARLDAVVVGNVASLLNGAEVSTSDLDLLVRDTPLNRKKLDAFARAIGGTRPQEISEMASVRRIFGALISVDVLFDKLPGRLSFASVKSRARAFDVGASVPLRVASLEDVIRSKKAANRPKDQAVMPLLELALASRKIDGLD